MNTALKHIEPGVLAFPELTIVPPAKERPTDSMYKSNGVPKATEADPIRNVDDIHAMQDYYLQAGNLRNYLVITLGIAFGLRCSDLVKLRIDDLMNRDGSVREYFEIREKKTRKFNRILIPENIRPYIDRYVTERQEFYKTKGKLELYMLDPFFVSRQVDTYGNRRPLTGAQAYNVVKNAAEAVGVQGHITTHSLRKTFAYHTIRLNPGNYEVYTTLQYMLNHDSLATTLRYCGITREEAMETRAQISSIL